jgi:antitoxin CptB
MMFDKKSDENRRGRLRFRSWHRGTREMDLLLGSFADVHLPVFTNAQIDLYEALLIENDPDLYNWITGSEPLPAEHDNEVMRLLCAHQYAKN